MYLSQLAHKREVHLTRLEKIKNRVVIFLLVYCPNDMFLTYDMIIAWFI
jgi:hypothetical protein